MSDLICCKNGKTVFIEIKAPGGRLSHHQQKFRMDLFRESIPYLVISDVSQLENIVNY